MPVAEAQARLLAMRGPLAAETLPIGQCAGRWLAEDVTALRDQPFADLSAMDGYAIRHADLPGPWRVTGTSAAGGAQPGTIGMGEAVRIFTGAPLPDRADTVIIQEDLERENDQLRLVDPSPVIIGQHCRKAGSDFRCGSPLIKAGTRLGPAKMALAAVGGHGSLPITGAPRIALLSTGNELVPPGASVGPGQLPASNALMLAAMLAPLPCTVTDLGIVPDSMDAMVAAFEQARDADIIVSTGGASVGDHDLVRPAFETAGGSLEFWKVRMRPGKPIMAGKLGDALFLGLPGNPVSSYVTATLFLLPLVRHLAGSRSPLPLSTTAILGAPLREGGERQDYLRATLTDGVVAPLTGQDSAALAVLGMADCLLVRPPHATAAQAGERVEIIPLG